MVQIAIISASIRKGRKSHRIALFFKDFLEKNNLATAGILDLLAYNFPLFDERLKFQEYPLPAVLDFAEKIKTADGVIIVTPEYNGGYPSSLKNAVDLLYDEWHHKPVAISTVSDGPFGGTQVITSLQFSLWKMKAWVVPATFPVTRVHETFDENGDPKEKSLAEKRAGNFIHELLKIIELKNHIL